MLPSLLLKKSHTHRKDLQGLLEVIKRIEEGELSETIEIRGSSYFFSERTARNLGFELKETGLFERFNMIVNVIDLTWMYSLAHGKLSLPNITDVQTASIIGSELVANKRRLQRLNQYLSNKISFMD